MIALSLFSFFNQYEKKYLLQMQDDICERG